jgi:hypothetical protein
MTGGTLARSGRRFIGAPIFPAINHAETPEVPGATLVPGVVCPLRPARIALRHLSTNR